MKPLALNLVRLSDLLAAAFDGVTLGTGVSIRQSEVIDRYGEGHSDESFAALPRAEITDDWVRISAPELERICVAHLDAEGFRYYIPALALSVATDYVPWSMRVIGTISALCPTEPTQAYTIQQHARLEPRQRDALTYFLNMLPSLVALDHEDEKRVKTALRDYWAFPHGRAQ